MANTYNSNLIVDSVTLQAETVLAKRLAPLSLFSTDFSNDVKKPKDTVQVKIATAGSATSVNPTSFNSIGGSTGDLAKLWAAVSKSNGKGLVVNPGIYSNLIPTNALSLSLTEGAYGFERGVYYVSSLPSEAKLAGFACDKQAVAVASAQPAMAGFRENMIASQTIAIPGLGLSVYFNLWADNISRSHIASFELMFGSGKGDTNGTLATIFNP